MSCTHDNCLQFGSMVCEIAERRHEIQRFVQRVSTQRVKQNRLPKEAQHALGHRVELEQTTVRRTDAKQE